MLPPGHPGLARTQREYFNADEGARFNGPNVEPDDPEDLEHDESQDWQTGPDSTDVDGDARACDAMA